MIVIYINGDTCHRNEDISDFSRGSELKKVVILISRIGVPRKCESFFVKKSSEFYLKEISCSVISLNGSSCFCFFIYS